eukprot:1103870-Rhodomonas_salina.1
MRLFGALRVCPAKQPEPSPRAQSTASSLPLVYESFHEQWTRGIQALNAMPHPELFCTWVT